MFANSEFLVLLNQAPTDRAELAKLLDASDAQMDYVSDAPGRPRADQGGLLPCAVHQ